MKKEKSEWAIEIGRRGAKKDVNQKYTKDSAEWYLARIRATALTVLNAPNSTEKNLRSQMRSILKKANKFFEEPQQ